MSNRKLFTLREICQATQGVQIAKNFQSKIQKKGFKRYFYISDFKHDKNIKYVEDIYPKKKFTSEDLIVSNTGSHGLVFTGKEGILSNNLFKVSFDNKIINKFFLLYFLESSLFKDFQSKRVRGTANPHMGHENFLNTPISLPQLSEQQRIVAKLDVAFTEIDKTNLINTKINKNLNEISDKFINLKFDSIVEKKTLGSLCDFLNGYAFKSKETVDASNVQLLRMGNLYNNKLDLGRRSVFYPESYANDYNKYIINPGDIVMTLTGTVGKRDYGYAIEISETKLKLLLNQRILKLHNFKSNSINKKYLLFYLNSKSFLNVLFKTANGTRQANLSSETIKTLKIPVTSMDNQIEILKKLKLLDESKKILLENLKTESKLLQSLKFSLIKNLIKDKAA